MTTMQLEDPITRIYPRSNNASPEAMDVDYVAIDEEEEEETVEATLIQRKGKHSLEVRNTPTATPTRSPRVDLSSDKDDTLQELTAILEAPSFGVSPQPLQDIQDIFREHYSSILDLQHQLYMKMKNDPQAQAVNLAIWDVLKVKYEKPSALIDTCRADAFHKRHHDDHSDDHLEGEKGLKKQKTTKGSLAANVTSSSKPTNVQRTKTSLLQPQQQEYDGWSTTQEIDDDEDLYEEASLEFWSEISRNDARV
ncbi:hypothetical protein Tco_0502811 [Tanacetum coccineum]